MRSNTPVTLTHHTTPTPLLPPPSYTLHAHQHPKRASLTRRVVGLVWRRSCDTGRTGRWRESQCGMRSPSQHTRPTYQHNHLVPAALAANPGSQSLLRSRKITKQFKSRIRTRMAGSPIQTSIICSNSEQKTLAARTSSSSFYLLLQLHVGKGLQPLINHE